MFYFILLFIILSAIISIDLTERLHKEVLHKVINVSKSHKLVGMTSILEQRNICSYWLGGSTVFRELLIVSDPIINPVYIDPLYRETPKTKKIYNVNLFEAAVFDYARVENTKITDLVIEECKKALKQLELPFWQKLRIHAPQYISRLPFVNKPHLFKVYI